MAESRDNHAHSGVTISPDAKATDAKSDATQMMPSIFILLLIFIIQKWFK